MKTIRSRLSLIIIAICFAWVMCSCTFQVNSDGSKSGSIDAAGLVSVLNATK